MPEEKARINIEKQEAKRDIVNVAGNYIIQHPITHEPVYIPTIQSVLRKGETTEGDFFKKEPEWVDYEQGFIVERKEVDEFIKKLETNKIQLVLGAPASGKSIILKNVGFKLADKNKVYVVELKKHPQDEIKNFFENIPKIGDDETIFIVDDAHLNLSECEKLIRNFRSIGKGNLIIGTRETKEITEGDPTKASEFEYLSKTAIKIRAEDVTEEMIKTFLESKYKFNGERIKSVSGSLDKYKKDLWHLSWALKAYKPDKDTVDEDTIYEIIKERIKITKAENVFLPLAVFYRYEIPIERKFLEKQLGIKKETIDDLIGLNEIVETEEIKKPVMLSLHHSSIAKLYFGVYQNYPDLGIDIKEEILNGRDKEDLEYCSFYLYITTANPRNTVDFVINLGEDDWLAVNYRETLIQKLIKKEKIQKSIELGIEKEDDIGKIGNCVRSFGEEKFKNPDGYQVYELSVSRIDKIMVNRLSIDNLSSKIEKEENIEKVWECVSGIAWVDENMGFKLLNKVSVKIEKETDIGEIGSCILAISYASKESGQRLINNINIDNLSSKIEKEKDIEKIAGCLSAISYVSKEIANMLINNINIDNLFLKIEKIENIETYGEIFQTIAYVSEEIANRIPNYSK